MCFLHYREPLNLSGCGVGFNQYRVIPFGLAFSPCTFTKCVDVSILPQHRKFLRFAFGGEAYQYRVIPFGLAFSPCTFTKCVDAALAPPWLQGIRILNCIDDWLILVQSEQTLVRHRDVILAHMKELGLRLNAKKSVLSPLQRTTYLGVVWDSTTMQACLSPARIESILTAVARVREGRSLTVKQFQKLLGLMAAAWPMWYLLECYIWDS